MRLFIFTFLLFCPFMINAQFKLTINGFVDENNENNDYIVVDFPEKSQSQLYVEALKFINTSYKSPKDVLNEVPEEMITISGFQPNKIGNGKIGGNTFLGVWDLRYNITLRFKDNKIRIDSPSFECTGNSGGKPTRLTMSGSNGGFGAEVTKGLFKKNGNPSMKGAINQLEDFFNTFSIALFSQINNESNNDW